MGRSNEHIRSETMKVYTVNATSYHDAKDLIRSDDYQDFAPYGAYQSRHAAEMSILKELNEARAEEREFEEEGKLPGFTDFPDILHGDMKWVECPTYVGTLRWKYIGENEVVYTIVELELEG
jgi:hypothetical protein